MNQDDQVVFEVTASDRHLDLKRKSGPVRTHESLRSITMTWETQFDLRTELGISARELLSHVYGVDPTNIIFLDAAGNEL